MKEKSLIVGEYTSNSGAFGDMWTKIKQSLKESGYINTAKSDFPIGMRIYSKKDNSLVFMRYHPNDRDREYHYIIGHFGKEEERESLELLIDGFIENIDSISYKKIQ